MSDFMYVWYGSPFCDASRRSLARSASRRRIEITREASARFRELGGAERLQRAFPCGIFEMAVEFLAVSVPPTRLLGFGPERRHFLLIHR